MTLNSYRYLFNGLVKSVINAQYTMPFREIHLSIHPMFKSVEDKLGLPRPRRPLSGYLRFAGEIRPSLTAENPNLNSVDIIKLIAKKWRSLTEVDREKFIKEYDGERLNYIAKLTKYKETLSEEDKERIDNMKAERVERKRKLSKKKQSQELSKPKKPIGSFFKYLMEQKDSQAKRTKAEYREHIRNVGSKWRALSDAEREKYNSLEEMEIYQKAMKEWESKMIDSEHYDVIRKTKLEEAYKSCKS